MVHKEAMKELDVVESLIREQDRKKQEDITKIASLEDMLRASHASVEAMRQHFNNERFIDC